MIKNMSMCVLLLGSLNAYAADFSVAGVEDDGAFCPFFDSDICVSFYMDGPIEKGDAEWLENRIKKMKGSVDGLSARIGVIDIDSPGGDVYEAMRLGRIMRENRIQAIVSQQSVCYSACVLVLAGAVGRFTVGEVGVHSFYNPGVGEGGFDYQDEERRFREVSEGIGSYLDEMRVSRRLLDEMMNAPASTINILGWEKVKDYSLFGIDPLFHQYLRFSGYLEN